MREDSCPCHLEHIRYCPLIGAMIAGEMLRERTGLLSVRIIPMELFGDNGRNAWATPGGEGDQFSIMLGEAGAPFIQRELTNDIALRETGQEKTVRVGLAGGRSVFGLFNALKAQSFKGIELEIEPLVVGPVPHSLYSAMSVSELAAQKFAPYAKPMDPAIFDIVGGWFRLKSHPLAPTTIRQFNWLVVGIGSKNSSSFRAQLGAIPHDREKQDAAIGDFCSRLFNNQGEELDPELCDGFVRISFKDLADLASPRERCHVIAIAGGHDKVDAIRALLTRSPRLFNCLITDELTGKELLQVLPPRENLLCP